MTSTLQQAAHLVHIKSATATVKASNEYLGPYLAAVTDNAVEARAAAVPIKLDYSDVIKSLVDLLEKIKSNILNFYDPEDAIQTLTELRSDVNYITNLKNVQTYLRSQKDEKSKDVLAGNFIKMMYLLLEIHSELQKLSEIDENSEEYAAALGKAYPPTPLSESKFISRTNISTLFD